MTKKNSKKASVTGIGRIITPEVLEFFKEHKIEDYFEYLEHKKDIEEDHLITSGKIFEYDPQEFFSQYKDEQRLDWFEKIDSLGAEYIVMNVKSVEEFTKRTEWLKAYMSYRQRETVRNPVFNYHTTLSQQLLTLYFLHKGGLIPILKINKSHQKLSIILSFLLNRGESKFYDQFKKFFNGKYDYKYFRKEDLLLVKEKFTQAGLDEIIPLIDKELAKLK